MRRMALAISGLCLFLLTAGCLVTLATGSSQSKLDALAVDDMQARQIRGGDTDCRLKDVEANAGCSFGNPDCPLKNWSSNNPPNFWGIETPFTCYDSHGIYCGPYSVFTIC